MPKIYLYNRLESHVVSGIITPHLDLLSAVTSLNLAALFLRAIFYQPVSGDVIAGRISAPSGHSRQKNNLLLPPRHYRERRKKSKQTAFYFWGIFDVHY